MAGGGSQSAPNLCIPQPGFIQIGQFLPPLPYVAPPVCCSPALHSSSKCFHPSLAASLSDPPQFTSHESALHLRVLNGSQSTFANWLRICSTPASLHLRIRSRTGIQKDLRVPPTEDRFSTVSAPPSSHSFCSTSHFFRDMAFVGFVRHPKPTSPVVQSRSPALDLFLHLRLMIHSLKLLDLFPLCKHNMSSTS